MDLKLKINTIINKKPKKPNVNIKYTIELTKKTPSCLKNSILLPVKVLKLSLYKTRKGSIILIEVLPLFLKKILIL